VGRISEDDIVRVREATDLVQLVSETVPLRQKGRLFWGLCPFHGEKTPSLKIDPGSQLWHCFGCSLGGDAFKWVMQLESMEFPDAVRQLADRARIEIREEAGGLPSGRRERLSAACEQAAEFYHRRLTTGKEPDAQTARDYLKGRGFGSDVAKRWRLGHAGTGRGALTAALTKAGFARDELVEANLSLIDDGGHGAERGALKDRFFGRIMFPITDVSGRVIAFGGRVLGDGQPKYLNSADTPIFHKSANLYGIDRAKAEIVASGTAVVVEGYTDVIALHEAGLRSAVATLGTALTARHVKLLARFAKRIVYLFDGDAAGMRAADRAAEFLDFTSTPEAGSARVDLAVAVIPEGQDPADYVGAHGVDAVRELIADAVPLLRFVIDRRLDAHDLTAPEGRSNALAAAARVLASVRGSILAQDYANHVAGRLRVDYETVMQSVRNAKPEFTGGHGGEEEEAGRSNAAAPQSKPTKVLDAESRAEEELLRMAVAAPGMRAAVRELLKSPDAFADPLHTRIATALADAGDVTGNALYEAVAPGDPEAAEALTAWLVGVVDVVTAEAGFPEAFTRIKEFALRRQILRLQAAMQGIDPVKEPARHDDTFRQVAALRGELETLRAGRESFPSAIEKEPRER
jgi:DNA primase